MSSVDGYLVTAITDEPRPIDDIVSEVREAVDATIIADGTLIPLFLSDGLVAYDEDDKTWYARVRVAVIERIYELALHGFVSMTSKEVRWAR